jgi:quinol monooxygenase YgiN
MGQPGMVESGISYVQDEVMPRVRDMDGYVGLSLIADRDSGRCIVTTAWRDEDAMRSSADAVMPLRERAAGMFGGDTTVDEWEVAYLHRDHRSAEGACARVTWVEGDPATIDRAVDMFKMTIMPKVEQIEGFCSASLLVDRMSGRCCITASYDSTEAMTNSRDIAMRLRADLSQETGMRITEVAEFELAIAHLDVPELV